MQVLHIFFCLSHCHCKNTVHPGRCCFTVANFNLKNYSQKTTIKQQKVNSEVLKLLQKRIENQLSLVFVHQLFSFTQSIAIVQKIDKTKKNSKLSLFARSILSSSVTLNQSPVGLLLFLFLAKKTVVDQLKGTEDWQWQWQPVQAPFGQWREIEKVGVREITEKHANNLSDCSSSSSCHRNCCA